MPDEKIRQKHNESEDHTEDSAALCTDSRGRAALIGRKTDVGTGSKGHPANVGQFEKLGQEKDGGKIRKSRLGHTLLFFPLSKGMTSWRKI